MYIIFICVRVCTYIHIHEYTYTYICTIYDYIQSQIPEGRREFEGGITSLSAISLCTSRLPSTWRALSNIPRASVLSNTWQTHPYTHINVTWLLHMWMWHDPSTCRCNIHMWRIWMSHDLFLWTCTSFRTHAYMHLNGACLSTHRWMVQINIAWHTDEWFKSTSLSTHRWMVQINVAWHTDEWFKSTCLYTQMKINISLYTQMNGSNQHLSTHRWMVQLHISSHTDEWFKSTLRALSKTRAFITPEKHTYTCMWMRHVYIHIQNEACLYTHTSESSQHGLHFYIYICIYIHIYLCIWSARLYIYIYIFIYI